LVEEREELELMNVFIVAAIDGLEDDVCLMDVDSCLALCQVGDDREKLWLWWREL
jgi:hypothetical protein